MAWRGVPCGFRPCKLRLRSPLNRRPGHDGANQESLRALLNIIERHPGAAFAALLLLHTVLWTALPAALYINLPLDLIEARLYGREWQLGYDKLPPLPWWLVEITYRIFGRDLFLYLLSQAVVVISFVVIWMTARPLVGPLGALTSVLILDGLHYFHYTAQKFNHDVIQLPFWALAGFSFHAALRGGRLLHWSILGLSVGLALWAKYFVAVLAIPLVLFMLLNPAARRHFATAGPYVALAVALLVAAPHLIWLVQNEFLPFRYAAARAAPARNLLEYVLHPLEFVAGQLLFLLPALAIAAPLWRDFQRLPPPPIDKEDWRIVTLLAFGPAATVFALSLLTGRGTITMWGYPLWLFLGLWIVLLVQRIRRERLAAVATVWAVVFFAFVLAFIVNYTILPDYDKRQRAVFFPGQQLANEISTRFGLLTGRPLAYVIGSMWLGGNIAHYAPERPRVLIDGRPGRAPWIDLGDLRARGAAVVWTDGDLRTVPTAFRALAADAEVQEPFTLTYHRGGARVTFGWAVLRPRPVFAAAE
jgi:4-amino-4-deoxy-L-arabinose transferase-like glycosyltransferase